MRSGIGTGGRSLSCYSVLKETGVGLDPDLSLLLRFGTLRSKRGARPVLLCIRTTSYGIR